MPLGLNSSRPLRSTAQLTALVEAIVAAPTTEPETDVIEWKAQYDLRGNPDHKFGAGRHILGFGNRHPDRSRSAFEGCGYLVLGAEPGRAPGIAVEDPADLENWVGPYVGADGPVWSLTYVKAQGADVLVVSIEAPRWGDRIHTLQKGYGNAQAGRIFIRRNGQTEEANQIEMRMLEERVKRAASRVRVDIFATNPDRELRTFSAASDDRANWINSEHARLVRPESRPTRRNPFEYAAPHVGLLEDARSREQYDREVGDYLPNAGERWYALVFEGAVVQRLAPVELVIANETEENFASVQVELQFPAGLYPFLDRDGPHELLAAPEAPKPWGKKALIELPDVKVARGFGSEAKIGKQGQEFHVAFTPVHVRPHASVPLPPLYLAIPRQAYPADEVRVQWSATSTSAAGAVTGEVVLPVGKHPVAAPQLVSGVT
jgi:hypothetical protein